DGIPDWRDPTPIIDVSVKIAGVERPGDGDDLVFTLEVANAGPFPAAGTVVTFEAPVGSHVTGVEHLGWRTEVDEGAGRLLAGPAADPVCSVDGRQVTCELGTVEDGWISTLAVTARVDEPGDAMVAEASVTAIGHDVDPANNHSSLAVRAVVTVGSTPLPAQLAFTGVRFGLVWWLVVAAVFVGAGIGLTVVGDRRRRRTGHA
ncbi:MAG: hypothetical protein D6683_05830, partial [Actinomyces sp.]